ncbi:MAG: hypothetical protein U0270_00045 [Labilithrix sp.]
MSAIVPSRSVFLFIALATVLACSPAPQSAFGGRAGDDDDDAPKTAQSAALPVPAGGAAADAEPPAVDPFAGAPAFTARALETSTSDHHLGDSNAGKDCLACHGKNMGAPAFLFAGTIQKSSIDKTGAEGVEVRVIDAAGTEVAAVSTDENGNFWLLSDATLPAGASVGIRDATGTRRMSGRIGVGACNQSGCHTKDRPIFLAK